MKNKSIMPTFLAILAVILIVAVAVVKINDHSDSNNPPAKSVEEQEETSQSGIITVDGVRYKPNSAIKTILFMGIDKDGEVELEGMTGGHGQCDSINLLILNTETKIAQLLQVNRDTMVDIDIYGKSGGKYTTERGQLCLQYAYVDGKENSCLITAQKVSQLLYNTKIDNYLSITIDGMETAADLVGGIEVTFPRDFTEIDPSYTAGNTVKMNGKQVNRFVRHRDIEQLESNVDRMERQTVFISSLMKKFKKLGSTSKMIDLYEKLFSKYMITDLTADQMKELSEYDYEEEILSIKGEIILKDEHAQFIADNNSIKELVIKTFYKPINN